MAKCILYNNYKNNKRVKDDCKTIMSNVKYKGAINMTKTVMYEGKVWTGTYAGKHYEIIRESRKNDTRYVLVVDGESFADAETYMQALDELEYLEQL